ncbi:hypothetical protein [Phytoactinopolyspora endophytica]|uniref:hypothetical protein n=1 Tax=Phytoactinopolyspora endophytica TaxID=1642495 RepID=UPI00101C90A3|nr:hypothetical protein [Phytoactinopolyspora endophytica]
MITRRFVAAVVALLTGATMVVAGSTAVAGSGEERFPYVGAFAGDDLPDDYDRQLWWDKAQEDIGRGRLTYRRVFDPTIPAVGEEDWRKTDAPCNFYSVKPPDKDVQGYIDGLYDDRLRALVEALPECTVFTVYHEPEDNMSGQTFYQLMSKTVDVVKSVRPDIEVWYVAMAYQWMTNSKGNVATNDGWLDAAKIADGVGIDVYAPRWYFRSMEEDDGFWRWWDLIKVPSGKKWGVLERGISADYGEDARATMLRDDWKFSVRMGAEMFLYWHTNIGMDEEWWLLGKKEQQVYQNMAAQGRKVD